MAASAKQTAIQESLVDQRWWELRSIVAISAKIPTMTMRNNCSNALGAIALASLAAPYLLRALSYCQPKNSCLAAANTSSVSGGASMTPSRSTSGTARRDAHGTGYDYDVVVIPDGVDLGTGPDHQS
jgi:hypothetical protein